MNRWSTTLILLIISIYAKAQSVSGRVEEAGTSAPLAGVSIRLLPGSLGTVTDENGRYRLNARPGSYRLLVSALGYRTRESRIDIRAGETLDVRLEPTAITLNQHTVVTTTRTETGEFARPEVTSVLTATELRRRAPRTVPEALFGLPGVWLQKTNHGGGSPFVRGLTGQQTLLLVDGIRLNNATFRSGPNQYLNTIDPQSVERIEVVRSSGSVGYGSDAIGGVVNVLTRTPQFSEKKGFTGRAFGKVASAGMEYSSRAEAGYQSATLAVTGGLAYRKFGDLLAGRGLGFERPTGYTQLSGDIKARARLGSRYVATAAYQDLEQDRVPVFHKVQLENFQYNQFDPQRRQLAYARLEGFYGSPWLESVQVTASWQRQIEGRQSRKNGTPTEVQERDQTATSGLTLLARSQPATFWQIQTGVELYADRVSSVRRDVNVQTGAGVDKRGLYPDGATMNSLAAFQLHTLTFQKLTLTAGGRYNAYEITIPEKTLGEATVRPSALVGNAGVSYAVIPAVRLVASVQSAFRAPNVDDMGTLGIVDFRYEVPNNSLKPERSLNKEAGVKIRTNRFSAAVLGYHNALTNFISRVRAGRDSIQGYPVYLKHNSSEAFIRGLETDVEWEAGRNWLVYGNLNYTYGQNVTAAEPFRRIPPLNGRAGVTYQKSAYWLRAETLLAAKQDRLAKGDKDDNRIPKGGTPGWQIVNLSGGYRWRSLTVSAELHNLTNEAYRTHGSGVDGVGRSAWIAVEIGL
ncbi:TonB-dependent receptor [Tellurirhabdus rosea]|uniref:TonB-dependent receptor n=1 Tax=Tellurirhabdus rosea TaxID=2674997 RepID=UPI00224D470D|nr:TonB-dependent receptor [Tellurirhabdus rosea]